MKVLKPSKVRTEADRAALTQAVSEIIANVRANGDNALIDYNTRFDQCDRTLLRVSPEEIQDAYAQVTEQELADIKKAAANIEAFAAAQKGNCGNSDGLFPVSGNPAGTQSDSC